MAKETPKKLQYKCGGKFRKFPKMFVRFIDAQKKIANPVTKKTILKILAIAYINNHA